MDTISDRRSGGVGGVGLLIMLFFIGLLGMPAELKGQTAQNEREAKVKSAIPPSIVEMDEVDWVEYDDNEVYVGFNRFPSDLKPMINAWAVQANWALGFGVRVYAVLNAPKGWRPGAPSAGLYVGAARHGKIED